MPKRKKSGREYWRRVLKEWSASGKSQRGFCEDRGVSLSSFCYWRRRLRAEGEVASPSPFIPVEVRGGTMSPQPTPFEVWLRNGIRIRVPADFESESLVGLIGLLERDRC